MKEKRDLGTEMFEAMGIKVVDCTPREELECHCSRTSRFHIKDSNYQIHTLNRCYTSTPQSSEELKKELEREFDEKFGDNGIYPDNWKTSEGGTHEELKSFISSLLAKQKEEIIADLKKDPLKLIKFHPQYKDLAREADERIQIQIDAYNDAKEEFVKCIPEIKLIEGHGFQDPRTDYKIGYNQCIADIKSKLNKQDETN
jgi:hypothetical protein